MGFIPATRFLQTDIQSDLHSGLKETPSLFKDTFWQKEGTEQGQLGRSHGVGRTRVRNLEGTIWLPHLRFLVPAQDKLRIRAGEKGRGPWHKWV